MSGRAGRLVYNSPRWAAVRRIVLERDGWRCVRCGLPGRLEVHHRQRVADGGAPFDPANLETVCWHCHIEEHKADQAGPRAAWRAWALEA